MRPPKDTDMDDESRKLFSAMDELEKAIKPYVYCQNTHCREVVWLLMSTINEARYLLIHAKRERDRHALPD